MINRQNKSYKTKPNRTIRSFVRREGRMTLAQQSAWERLWPLYGLSSAAGEVDLEALFGRSSEKILEIGFGDGQSLLEMARLAPDKDFIGVEVYRTGVATLLLGIEKEGLSNIRIFCADAVDILTENMRDKGLSKIQVFFADPWPKARHHKRRLVQPAFLQLVAKKLQKGGLLHLATDWMDYAYHMMSVVSAAAPFENIAGAGKFMPRPSFRPLTKYEQRGLSLGHQTWDLICKLSA